MPRKESVDYDVLIAGGGMVGATLACALGQAGMRVALVEAQEPPSVPQGDHDLRVSAISVGAQRIFQHLGIWPGIEHARVSPLRAMRVWDALGAGHIEFDAAELGLAELGYIVENRVIAHAAWQVLAGLEAVRSFPSTEIVSFDIRADAVSVRLSNDMRLRGALLVGADGASSQVRRLAGIATQGWGYRQQSIVATVRTGLDPQSTAYQVFLPSGPLAFLPLAPHLSSIVWSCDTTRAEQLLAMSGDEFRAALAESFGQMLGSIETVSTRAAFDLSLAHAQHYVQERIALVGDAAHRVHPLAGQGVNLGLMDAATLVEVVLAARERRRDIGSHAVLRRFERWRKGENLAMLAATDAFKRGFGQDWTPWVSLRGVGMRVVNRASWLKSALMRRACGLEGDLPALARASVSTD